MAKRQRPRSKEVAPSTTVPDHAGPTQRLWKQKEGSDGLSLDARAGLAGFDELPDETTTAVTKISKISDQPVSEAACLVVIYGEDLGKRFDLDRPRIKVGRGHRCHVSIDQEAVSRNHAEIVQDSGGYVLRDLRSTNGTFVNDAKIAEHRLNDGDLLKIGRSIFKFIGGGNVESAYHEEIYRLTTIDGLTQIYNRRFFFEALTKELSRARRYRRTLSLAMFDIDHFKKLNDAFGHLAGDSVLKQVASAIANRIRREDTFARFGGEEFAIILPEIDLEQARAFGEKVRGIIGAEVFSVLERTVVTVSVGVAHWDGTNNDPEELIRRADEALYQAKQTGRNRVCG